MILETAHIRLRALEPGDDRLIMRWENDPEIWKQGSTLMPFSLSEIRNYIHSVKDIYTDKQLRLMIEEKQSEDAVGMIDLFDFEPMHQKAAIGIFVDPSFRAKGYGKQSLELICRYAAEILGLHQVYATIRLGNVQSIQLFGRCGFNQVAELPDWLRNGNSWENQLILQKILE